MEDTYMKNMFKQAIAVTLISMASFTVQAMQDTAVQPRQLEQIRLHEQLIATLNFLEALSTEAALAIQDSDQRQTIERMRCVAMVGVYHALHHNTNTLTPQDELIIKRIMAAFFQAGYNQPTKSKL